MLMYDPPHPGAFIRRQCLEPLGLTVTEAAKGLAVSRNTLSLLLNPSLTCAVERRVFLVGANPTQQLSLRLVAARAVCRGNDVD